MLNQNDNIGSFIRDYVFGHEDSVEYPYLDSNGILTAGVDLGREIGRVVDAVFGNTQPVTPAEA